MTSRTGSESDSNDGLIPCTPEISSCVAQGSSMPLPALLQSPQQQSRSKPEDCLTGAWIHAHSCWKSVGFCQCRIEVFVLQLDTGWRHSQMLLVSTVLSYDCLSWASHTSGVDAFKARRRSLPLCVSLSLPLSLMYQFIYT